MGWELLARLGNILRGDVPQVESGYPTYPYSTPPYFPEEMGRRMGQDMGPGNIFKQAPSPTDNPIFAPGANPEDTAQAGLPTDPVENDAFERIMNVYQPSHGAEDRLTDILNRFPERGKPSIWNRLLSIPATVSYGLHGRDEALYGDYNNQVEDYRNRLAPALRLAEIERYNNANERQLVLGAMQRDISERRARATEELYGKRGEKIDADIARDKEKLDIQRKKAEVAGALQRDRNLQLVKDTESGEWTVVNRATRETFKTGLKHGDISDIENINMRQEDALERIGKTQESINEREQDKGWQYFERDGKLYRVKGSETPQEVSIPGEGTIVKPGTAKTGGAGKKGDEGKSDSQIKQERINRASELIARRPELGDWITKDQFGNPTVKADEPGMFWGKTLPPGERARINEYIFEGRGPGSYRTKDTGPVSKSNVTPGATQGQGQAIPPEGWILMKHPKTGAVGRVPMKQLQSALSQGYTKVQ